MNIQVFHKIIQASVLLLTNYDIDVTICKQEGFKSVIQSIKQLKIQSLTLQKSFKYSQGIGIRNIYQKNGLRITLYYLPKGQIMQLHNHPQMIVISYILKGILQADNFTPIDEGKDMKFSRQKGLLSQGSFSFIDGMRTYENNLHGLKAIQNTFFLDILFPDYNQSRQCYFFEVEQQLNQKEYTLKVTGDQNTNFFQI